MKILIRSEVLRPLAVALLAAMALPARAAEFFLVADETTHAVPGGTAVPVWAFGLETDGEFTTDVEATPALPGPALAVAPGETTLTIHVLNRLSVPISIVVPGLIAVGSPTPTWVDENGIVTLAGQSFRAAGDVTSRVRSFAAETAPGAVGTYAFQARAGTYLYQSGTDPAVQVKMGLFGAVTQAVSAGEAYPQRFYAREHVLLFSELDPAFNAAVAASDYALGLSGLVTINTATGTSTGVSLLEDHPKYFLVNGASYPSAALELPVTAGEAVLLRVLNAGMESRVPLLLGATMTVLAEDGKAYGHARGHHAPLLAAGTTLDALVTFGEGRFPLFDRRLGLTAGVQGAGWNASSQGMLVTLVSTAPAGP